MSTLIATALSIGKLNDQTEIIAMRAGGLGFFPIFKPFLFIGFILSSLLVYHSQVLLPYCFTKMNSIISNIYNHNPIAIIDTGRFLLLDKTDTSEKSIFIEKKMKNGKLINLQLRTKKVYEGIWCVTEFIVAPEGILLEKIDEYGQVTKILRFFNGYVITKEPNEDNFKKVDFSKGSLDLSLSKAKKDSIQQENNRIQGLKSSELLLQYAILKQDPFKYREAVSYMTEYHKRIALPPSTLIFMFIGLPLAMTNKRSGKGFGLGSSIIIIFIYFGLYLATDPISTSLFIPPWIAAWLANLQALCFGIYLYWKRFT